MSTPASILYNPRSGNGWSINSAARADRGLTEHLNGSGCLQAIQMLSLVERQYVVRDEKTDAEKPSVTFTFCGHGLPFASRGCSIEYAAKTDMMVANSDCSAI
jgi:hypothetical protein